MAAAGRKKMHARGLKKIRKMLVFNIFRGGLQVRIGREWSANRKIDCNWLYDKRALRVWKEFSWKD